MAADPVLVAAPPSKSASSLPAASGYSGSQSFSTYPGKDQAEPNICGAVGGASYWFTYVPPENGTLFLSTDGSNFDTLLGVFVDDGRNLGYASLVQQVCDNNSGTNGQASALLLPVKGGTNYYIMVDGVNGACGRVSLSYRLDSAPAISAIATQSIMQDQNVGPISFTIGDRETAASNLVVTGSSPKTNWVPVANIHFGGAGTARTVLITPLPGTYGTNPITITVTDSVGGVRSISFVLNVAQAPKLLGVATRILPSATAGAAYSTQLLATGGVAGYTWTLISGSPSGLQLDSNGFLSGVPTQAGTNQFTARVTDAGGNTASCAFTVTVEKRLVNLSGQVVLEGYDGPAHDGCGRRLVTFSFTDGATFTNRTEQTLTFVSGVGAYTLRVTADTVRISGKTSWHLRKTVAVSLPGTLIPKFTLLAGDLDGSNRVDVDDNLHLVSTWQKADATADIDGDGRVAQSDYFLLANHWHEVGDSE